MTATVQFQSRLIKKQTISEEMNMSETNEFNNVVLTVDEQGFFGMIASKRCCKNKKHCSDEIPVLCWRDHDQNRQCNIACTMAATNTEDNTLSLYCTPNGLRKMLFNSINMEEFIK